MCTVSTHVASIEIDHHHVIEAVFECAENNCLMLPCLQLQACAGLCLRTLTDLPRAMLNRELLLQHGKLIHVEVL